MRLRLGGIAAARSARPCSSTSFARLDGCGLASAAGAGALPAAAADAAQNLRKSRRSMPSEVITFLIMQHGVEAFGLLLRGNPHAEQRIADLEQHPGQDPRPRGRG